MIGELSVLDHTGDLKTIWDSDKPAEVDAAREQYEKMVDKGYAAFRVSRNGKKGEQIRKFDPEAEAIILTPPMVGG